LYIANVADNYGDYAHQRSAPMRVAHHEKSLGTLLGMPMTRTASSGELEAGVCRRCGYTEFYTKAPDQIIVDGTHVRELVGTQAYRE
jgi:hypothetical protein